MSFLVAARLVAASMLILPHPRERAGALFGRRRGGACPLFPLQPERLPLLGISALYARPRRTISAFCARPRRAISAFTRVFEALCRQREEMSRQARDRSRNFSPRGG